MDRVREARAWRRVERAAAAGEPLARLLVAMGRHRLGPAPGRKRAVMGPRAQALARARPPASGGSSLSLGSQRGSLGERCARQGVLGLRRALPRLLPIRHLGLLLRDALRLRARERDHEVLGGELVRTIPFRISVIVCFAAELKGTRRGGPAPLGGP